MPTKLSFLIFLRTVTLALIFVVGTAVPTFAQRTIDRPNEERQSQLCSTVALGNLEYLKVVVSELHSTGEFSANSIVPAYPDIRCGEAGLTLLMVAISSGNKNRRGMMTYMFNALHESETKQLNETNYSGETDLDVIYSLGDTVSARFTKRFVNEGAKTAADLMNHIRSSDHKIFEFKTEGFNADIPAYNAHCDDEGYQGMYPDISRSKVLVYCYN